MGLELELPDSGCCGMAGAWGYERDHYDVSIACGERALFPAARAADDETLVVTDGFSCRTQLEQGTGRRALHVAEVLRLADGQRSEQPVASGPRRVARTAALVGSALVGALGLALCVRR